MTVDAPASEPRVLERAEHRLSRQNIDANAVKVLYRLHNAGFKGYLVGGGVRDLLLGHQPKDFDVATDARPNEVRRLFRNSRIIGRRFRLAHVFFKEGVIEVSTFRRDPDPGDQASGPDELLITSDNTFGTPREDAFRRDFTVNALFYDIGDFSVIDYVDGLEDLSQRLIRTIGDPDVRFQEDPVRMLRACELAGRLGFGIEKATQEAIERHAREIEKASPARLTEEILELLRSGRAGAALQWMLELGILEALLPEAYAMVGAGRRGMEDFGRMLPAIDRMVSDGREFSDATLLAALLLPTVVLRRVDVEALDGRPMRRGDVRALVAEVAEPFVARLALSAARSRGLKDALAAFQLLGEPDWKPAQRRRFARRPGVADAVALLEIMVRASGEGGEVLASWQAVASEPAGRPAGGGGRGGRRRRRRRRRPRRSRAAAG